ncbi:MAG: LPXTG cell wall anchor domain-containing protein, partial [Corynebacterium striatum]|nr:LPXTG cell wall anchor domain-containing protein [Corynebacterium striatum]
VEQPCEISEITAGDAPIAYTELGEVGPRIGDAEAVNITDSETGTVVSGGWNFTVLPVAEVSDPSTSGPNWALTGVNSFPGINITKKIDGAPISAVTGRVADTAVLPDDATTMRFNYTLENNGAMPLTDLKLTEAELAGRTVVAADGSEYVVPEGGAIPTEVCAPGDLAVGASTTCSFDVKITESTKDNFYYRGKVTVTALGNNILVSDDDSYGALRLKEGLAFLLPDTGRQTLVWALLIGLVLLAIGMALYLRNRNGEETDGEETDGED